MNVAYLPATGVVQNILGLFTNPAGMTVQVCRVAAFVASRNVNSVSPIATVGPRSSKVCIIIMIIKI